MKDKKITKITIRNLGLLTAFPLLSFLGLSCLNEPTAETTTPKHSHNHQTNSTKDQEKDHAHDEKDHHHEHEEKTVGRVESVDDYGLLVLEREQVVQQLKELEGPASTITAGVFESLESLNAKLLDTRLAYKELEQLRNQVNALTRTLENAEQDVTIASEKNWTLGKEIVLYLLGLKFLWGFTTGFAPTTSSTEQQEIYQKVKETVGGEIQVKTSELKVAESKVRRELTQLETLFEAAINKSTSAQQRAKLLTSKLALTNTFNQLLVAGNELDTQEALYREYFRYTLPTTPFAVASAKGVSQSDDHVGKFRFASLTEARTRKKMLEAKLAALFLEEGVEGLAKVAPAKLLAEVADSLGTTEAQKAVLQAKLEDLNSQLQEATLSNPEFENKYTESSVFQRSLETIKRITVEGYDVARVNDFLTAVESLRKSAGSVQSELESLAESQKQMQLAVEQVALREEALREATRRRHSFFRELTLYLLGFKFLWGAKTGFAPTVNVEKETQALNLAKENLAALEKYQGEEMAKKEGALKRALETLEENYRVAKSKAFSATQRSALTMYHSVFVEIFKKYVKDLESAVDADNLLLHDSVAETLFTTHTSGFVKFLRNFGIQKSYGKTLGAGFRVSGGANAANTFGVIEGKSGIPKSLELDMSARYTLSSSRKRFEDFLTNEGESILERVIRELEDELLLKSAAKRLDETNKRVVSKLTGLSLTLRKSRKKTIYRVTRRFQLETLLKRFRNYKVFVVYGRDSCPVCRKFKVELFKLLKSSDIKIIYFEISRIPRGELRDKKFSGVPFLEFYKKGKMFETHGGALPIKVIKELFNPRKV